MFVKIKFIWLVSFLVLGSCSIDRLYQINQSRKVSPYEQMHFNTIGKLYFAKDKTSVGTIKGIYSVSNLVTKKGRGAMSSIDEEKVVDRNENYSQVAIIQDKNTSGREYLEVPLDKEYVPSYSIRGELTEMTDGNILVYKHFEPRGKRFSYTFTYDKTHDILDGLRTEDDGSFTITYKLTYLKLFPKN
jgi:hypothetical protein